MTDQLIDPTVTCWGYGTWVEESIARAICEEREKVGLWYWDEDVQANRMKRELFEEISRLYGSLDNAKENGRAIADPPTS